MGGVGKTRLALEAATASRRAFTDGVWLVDLAPVLEPSAVADAAAAALGVPDLSTRPVLDQLAGHLVGRRALIVLDNCEHLVDACAELVETLLSAAPEVRSGNESADAGHRRRARPRCAAAVGAGRGGRTLAGPGHRRPAGVPDHRPE
jgi:predicted ATPase